MPARDTIHNSVRNALTKDGWTITHDPYRLPVALTQLLVDLGAERFVIARRGETKIAVEIKNLFGRSPIHELEQAIGQYILYQVTMKRREPGRVLYLAISQEDYHRYFLIEPATFVMEDEILNLVIVDIENEEIESWIPALTTLP
jgi:hypothetical protein